MILRLDDFVEFGGSGTSGSLRALVDGERVDEATARDYGFYLLEAETVLFDHERTLDVFDGEPTHLSASIKSDGTALWREDLTHYVLKYKIDVQWTRAARVHGVVLEPDQRVELFERASQQLRP